MRRIRHPIALARPTSGPSPTDSIQDSAILAVLCRQGTCEPSKLPELSGMWGPLTSQPPQFVPGPVLAVLRASDGSTAELDRPVLIGRAPSAIGRTAAPRGS